MTLTLNMASLLRTSTLILGLAALPTASLAAETTASSVSVEGQAGLRAGRFHAAPQTYDLWTQEVVASARTASLAAIGPMTLHLGGSLALSQMRGDLGPGLTALNGYRVGPEMRLQSQPFSPSLVHLRAFVSTAYQFGNFKGTGSPNWDSVEAPTMFLRGAETLADERKIYRTWGPHFAAGLTYDVATEVAVSAVYDYGVETMINDSTIITAGEEVSGRDRTTFTSKSFLLGGILAI